MGNLFNEGGVLFMSILTMVLALSIGLAAYYFVKKIHDVSSLSMIKSLGLFALVFGLLGQFIGLYSALSALSQMQGEVSPSILMNGIRISSITTIYGMVIFVISYLLMFALTAVSRNSIDAK